MTEPETRSESEEDRLLDEVFDNALEALERGTEPQVEPWLKGRSDLRLRAQEVVNLAREVLVHRPALDRSGPGSGVSK